MFELPTEMTSLEDLVGGYNEGNNNDNQDMASSTNLDALPPRVLEMCGNDIVASDKTPMVEQDLSAPSAGPRKRLRFDKLGRLIEEEEVTKLRIPEDYAVGPRGGTLKRPRGRPPKGKIWHERRGWVNQGVGPAGLKN